MTALLRPLVQAGTYRRAVFLLLGAVILLPYVLLAGLLARTFVQDPANRAVVLLVAVVAAVIAAVPPFLGGTRELEIAAARALLRADLPDQEPPGPLPMETRLRAALWFGVHLAVGAVIGAALLIAVPMSLGLLFRWIGWWWTVVGVLLLVGTVYAVAGLGALARTMAPVLLGPSPAARLAAVEASERRLAERNRLARELHDSVGHALTATTLQAGAARAVFDSDPEFARRALESIEEVGRTAMDDLDHVLGVLRDAGDTDRRPQPTLADLDRLTGGVDLVVRGDPATLAPALSREAYRIVQEGLTNAAKHGEGTASLRLTITDGLSIVVTNALCAPAGTHGGGRGLAGIGERVRLLGGRFEAGPADGVWRLTVRLPGGPA